MSDHELIPVVRNERPRRRTNRKLVFLLFLFFVILLGVLFFQSSLSKIQSITVEGNRLLTDEQIVAASDIAQGDHFFGTSSSVISKRVKELGAVDQAHIIKTFPGEVNIIVEEYPVVALELTDSGEIAGLLSNGSSIPYEVVEQAASRPILSGWTDMELKRRLAESLAIIPQEYLYDVSEIRPSVTVAYPDRIILYTRSQYEVVTRIAYLAEKILLLDDYIYAMQDDNIPTGRIILLETNYAEPFESSPDLASE